MGRAVRQDKPGGRFRAIPGDRFTRHVEVLTAQGPIAVSVRGIKTARALSAHMNAVGHFNRTGDDSKLRPFRGQTFKADGRRHEFLTDPDALMTLVEADALRLDSLYASVSSRS